MRIVVSFPSWEIAPLSRTGNDSCRTRARADSGWNVASPLKVMGAALGKEAPVALVEMREAEGGSASARLLNRGPATSFPVIGARSTVFHSPERTNADQCALGGPHASWRVPGMGCPAAGRRLVPGDFPSHSTYWPGPSSPAQRRFPGGPAEPRELCFGSLRAPCLLRNGQFREFKYPPWNPASALSPFRS